MKGILEVEINRLNVVENKVRYKVRKKLQKVKQKRIKI